MKSTLFAAMFGLATPAPMIDASPAVDQQPRADARELYRCKLVAMHAADNDIRLVEDARSRPAPTTLPPIVARTIRQQVVDDAKKYFTQAEWRESNQYCYPVFDKILRVAGPAGLQLYVAPRDFAVMNQVDYFVMYNPRTGAVTAAPPRVPTRWSRAFAKHDWLLKAPIVRMLPARAGLPPLLVVEEQLHGGTVYNVVIDHYFEIGRDMALTQVLAVEARAVIESGVHAIVQDYIVRKATFLTANRVRLDVSNRSSRIPRFEGSVLLERDHAGQPFHVGRRMPAHPGDAGNLVTYCESPKSDDDFLRLGCDS